MTFSFGGTKLHGFVMISSLVVGIATTQPAFADAAPKAGVVATVRNDVQGETGGAVHALLSGGAVFENDVVRTGKTGSAELLFLDQTNLKIAPGSDVKIDKFAYDPNASSGTVAIGVAKGALRFVTGAQDPRNYEIKTAVATIGVRGTILNIVATNDALAVVLADGKAIVTGKDGKTSTMEVKGNLVLIGPDGSTVDQSGSLTDAVAKLIQSSDNPAATAAQILAAIGAVGSEASAQNLQDIAAGIAQAGVGSDDLSRAVSDYVQGSVDQAEAASDIVSGAKYFDDNLKAATGKGLADAASEIGKSDPTTATEIDGAVEGSGDPKMQDSYSQQKESTRGIDNNNGGSDSLLQNQQQQQQQQSPN